MDFLPAFVSSCSTSFLLTRRIALFVEARSSGDHVLSVTGMQDELSGATGCEFPGIFSSLTHSTVPTVGKEHIVWSSHGSGKRALTRNLKTSLTPLTAIASTTGGRGFTSPRRSPAPTRSRRQILYVRAPAHTREGTWSPLHHRHSIPRCASMARYCL